MSEAIQTESKNLKFKINKSQSNIYYWIATTPTESRNDEIGIVALKNTALPCDDEQYNRVSLFVH